MSVWSVLAGAASAVAGGLLGFGSQFVADRRHRRDVASDRKHAFVLEKLTTARDALVALSDAAMSVHGSLRGVVGTENVEQVYLTKHEQWQGAVLGARYACGLILDTGIRNRSTDAVAVLDGAVNSQLNIAATTGLAGNAGAWTEFEGALRAAGIAIDQMSAGVRDLYEGR